MARRKVVFFFPAFSSQEATAPLGILAVSTPLLHAGYEVSIIDSTITPNFQRRVIEELEDALCLAVSLVTGPMIRETVQIAREVKRLYPGHADRPGRLASLAAARPDAGGRVRRRGGGGAGRGCAARSGAAHRGRRIARRAFAGVGYKEDGRIRFNAAAPAAAPREMPPKAYHLADFDAYERVCGRRWAMYTSSLACPYNCGYCTNDGVYGRKWNALEPEQVVEETTDLVSRYNLELLWIVDDNFLVDRERAVGIAEGLVRRGVKFDWSIQASTNLVIRLTVEELKLLRRAGLSQISQGADTGSPEDDAPDGQGFSESGHHLRGRRKADRSGHPPSFNLIFGYPGEGEKERRESVRLMMNICRRYPGAEFWTNIFTPYPGSPIMKRAFELGIEVPKTLEGWADFFPRYTVLPWLKGREHDAPAEHARVHARGLPPRAHRQVPDAPAAQALLFEMISVPARWRLDHHVTRSRGTLGCKNAQKDCSRRPSPRWTRSSFRPSR